MAERAESMARKIASPRRVLHRAARPAGTSRAPRCPSRMTALPPGPPGGLFATLRLLRDPYGAARRCVRDFGDPFTLRMPLSGPIVITGEPAAIRSIFAADPLSYASAASDTMAPIIGWRSIVSLEGAEHLRARKLLAPPFHGARMRAYGGLMAALTQRHLAPLSAGSRFTLQELAHTISLDVILQTIFGVTEAAQLARLDRAVRNWMGAIGPSIATFGFLRHEFGGIGPWAKFQRARAALLALVDEEIAAREREPDAAREDVLSLLLSARYDDGSAMSRDEVFDQLVTLVAAGHETTLITLTWACYWLHRNPAALARLNAELDALGSGTPAPEALVGLPYLEAVLQETLRLYPIVAVATRKLAQPFELAGHTLPAGVHVGAATSLVHYREELYPEPERFMPERFLERTFGPTEYFPFGGGARRCLGAAFATYELKIVLGTLLRTLRLRAADDRPVRPAMRAAGIGPGRAVKMDVIERRA
jgi:cytochrome P450 family 110